MVVVRKKLTTNGRPTTNGDGNSNGRVPHVPRRPVLNEDTFANISLLLTRQLLFGNRYHEMYDIDAVCGYPLIMYAEQYKRYWEREGLANKVVELYPNECWAFDPDVFESHDPGEESEFEVKWKQLVKLHNLYHMFHRLDCISGIGRYGIMLLGFNDGKDLSMPVESVVRNYPKMLYGEAPEPSKKPLMLNFTRVLDEALVQVVEWNRDQNSPRFGLPERYNVQFADIDVMEGTNSPAMPSFSFTKVHWSRVLHLASDVRGTNEVLGYPRLQRVLNRIYDVRKVCSGSAEMFWKGGYPGISFEVNPDFVDADEDPDALKRQMVDYVSGLSRYISTVGVSAKTLNPAIADPHHHLAIQIQLIAMAIDAPLQIFIGSEEARVAGTQSMTTWNKRLRRRQYGIINPMILLPAIQRFQMVGMLPYIPDPIMDWSDLNTPTDTDQAAIALKLTSSIVQYVSGKGAALVPPLEFLTAICGLSIREAQKMIQAGGVTVQSLLKAAESMQQKPGPQNPGGD